MGHACGAGSVLKASDDGGGHWGYIQVRGHTESVGGRTGDPRGLALADYLRAQAEALSLSADSTGEQHIARAGMALLDAAALAEHLRDGSTSAGPLPR